jgi:D-glycero-D-manno-heptose 1,7-bisphosphate phosphatase
VSESNKAIFFDRDGIVNRRIKGGYVRTWSEFELLPGVGEVLAEVKRRGYKAIIVTNQRGVGIGLMSEQDLHSIHEELQKNLLRIHDVEFDDVIYCADASDDSPRRKPSPTMLLEAAERWDIDLSGSWMVGDSASDIEAGRRAGTRTAYVVTEFTDRIPEADRVLTNIRELLDFV